MNSSPAKSCVKLRHYSRALRPTVSAKPRRLFSALCRRYGLEPYRYKGQRYTTVIVRAPRSFIDRTLWPEYLELQAALHAGALVALKYWTAVIVSMRGG